MAGPAFTMKFEGIEDLEKRLSNAPDIIQSEIKAKLRDGSQAIAQEAKQRAPVHYGILKNLISAIPPVDNDAGFSVEVVSGAAYSAYVEWGTGTKVEVPNDLEEYAIQFKGNHAVKGMSAQPFFFPAAKRQLPLMEADIQKTLEKL